jgi:hypothetical protein
MTTGSKPDPARGREPQHFAHGQVYFAFASGRFSYDCVACQAKCCRGHGYALRGSELLVQLSARKSVALFVDERTTRTGDYYEVSNGPPGCFFLRDGGLCGIHADQGFAAKPETCRLFPFNNFVRFGNYLVVAPHAGLCPLETVASPALSDCSRHELLLSAIDQNGIVNPMPELRVGGTEAALAMELETRVVALSEQHLHDRNYVEFAASQIVAAHQIAGAQGRGTSTTAAIAERDLIRFSHSMKDVLGSAPTTASEVAVVQTLVAATPTLRTMALFHRSSPSVGAIVEIDRLPRLLLAMHALVAHASDAGMKRPTYQTVSHLFRTQRDLLTLLADSDRPMFWRLNAPIDALPDEDRAGQLRYLQIVREIVAQRKTRTVAFGEILAEHLPAENLERIVYLKRLARHLPGRLTPRPGWLSRGIARRSLKSSVQQWLVGNANLNTLADVAVRRAQSRM